MPNPFTFRICGLQEECIVIRPKETDQEVLLQCENTTTAHDHMKMLWCVETGINTNRVSFLWDSTRNILDGYTTPDETQSLFASLADR